MLQVNKKTLPSCKTGLMVPAKRTKCATLEKNKYLYFAVGRGLIVDDEFVRLYALLVMSFLDAVNTWLVCKYVKTE